MKKNHFMNLRSDEILSRDELKRIVGGNGSGDGVCYATCYCDDGSTTMIGIIGCDSCEELPWVGLVCDVGGDRVTSDCADAAC